VIKETVAIKETVSENKTSYEETKKLKREFGQLEKDIERLQAKKKRIEEAFLNPNLSPEKIAEMGEELEQIRKQIEQKEERWLEVSMLLE